ATRKLRSPGLDQPHQPRKKGEQTLLTHGPDQGAGSGSVNLNECHYYELPWPADVLRQNEYYSQLFSLKITLSYFVEPNPGKSAAVDPANYQSFGLRFVLKRPGETADQFRRRINSAEQVGQNNAPAVDDVGTWQFGSNSITAGSLHCDIWTGTGAQLASRNLICVKPVTGWWKARKNPEVCDQPARYALVLTLDSRGQEIDLHTPISTAIAQPVEIDL
ncbi:MAG: hypothetical protein JJU26_09280, partial [Oceanicaulis sp.]|nr:hypothetical protein [Oceanicaulis sp.]